MTQKINLVAILEVKEGAWSHLSEIVKKCMMKSREEKGNHDYTIYFQKNNQNKIVFIECWENQQVFDQHCQTEHFQNLMQVVKTYATKPLELLNLVPVK